MYVLRKQIKGQLCYNVKHADKDIFYSIKAKLVFLSWQELKLKIQLSHVGKLLSPFDFMHGMICIN